MPEGIFEQAYPVALRAAQVRATAAVSRGSISPADRDDLEQETKLACFRALAGFDPTRASLRTYVECIVGTRTASFIRSAARRPIPQELNPDNLRDAKSAVGQLELRLDVERVLRAVSNTERRLALLLMEYTPTEASRILGLARSTVYQRVARLRIRFDSAGLNPQGRVTAQATGAPR